MRLAEMKVENTHFKYRTSERSGVEQFRVGRPITGLYNWPRGLYENLYRSGVKPFIDGVKTKNYNKAYLGLKSLSKTIIGMYLAREGAKKVLGKKTEYGAYDIGETLTGYNLGSPGLSLLLDSSKEFGQIARHIREGEVEKAISVMGNRIDFFLPLVEDLVRVYESNEDRKGVNVTQMVLKGMRKNLGKKAKRTSVEAWQHVFFGTWEKPEGKKSNRSRLDEISGKYSIFD